ncbi:STAS domain-containing protein [Streptomyces sp. cg35]|uniref:STAS domain-containing protein n=1 Tax=Streptomyces sp. cg35 TaxID=3421650 RepID=UPI003D18143C
MRASLQVTIRLEPERSVIVLVGDCDEDTGHLLDEALSDVMAGAPEILEIDVSRVEFGDSMLLHALLRALRSQRTRQGRLVLRGPLSVGVRRLLTETGTMDVFEDCVEDTERAEDGRRGRPGTVTDSRGCSS